jgi:hypothetical protein
MRKTWLRENGCHLAKISKKLFLFNMIYLKSSILSFLEAKNKHQLKKNSITNIFVIKFASSKIKIDALSRIYQNIQKIYDTKWHSNQTTSSKN